MSRWALAAMHSGIGVDSQAAQQHPYIETVLSQSPYAYWRLVDATGSDVSGNDRHGTIAGSPVASSATPLDPWPVGVLGSTHFTADYMSVTVPSAGSAAGMTFTCWVYFHNSPTNTTALMGRAGLDYNFYQARGRLYVGGDVMVAPSGYATTGVWRHYAIRRNGTAWTARIDNVTRSSGSWSGTWNPTFVARGNTGNTGNVRLAEFAYFDRFLTDAEVGDQYAARLVA